MLESTILTLCQRMSALETMVQMHLDAEWKFWAFFATLAGGLIVVIVQNHLMQKTVNGKSKKES